MSDENPGALVRIEAAPLEASLVPQSEQVSATPKDFRAAEINAVLMQAYLKAGTLVMTPEEISKLTADFPRSCIERRENRFNYIPHIHISRRLTEVFGPGQWTMIRRREWIIGNQVNAEWVLIVRGHFIGESVGSQEYHPNNARQNFADVLEATRGECIRRIAGKYLGCGGEAWDPAVARALDVQRTREALHPQTHVPAPRTDAGTTVKTAAPPSGEVAALKKRLWKITEKIHLGNAAGLEQWLWDEAFIDTTEMLGSLSAERLEAVLVKVEAKVKVA